MSLLIVSPRLISPLVLINLVLSLGLINSPLGVLKAKEPVFSEPNLKNQGRLDLYVFTPDLLATDQLFFRVIPKDLETHPYKDQATSSKKKNDQAVKEVQAHKKGLQLWLNQGQYQLRLYSSQDQSTALQSVEIQIFAGQSVEVMIIQSQLGMSKVEIEEPQVLKDSLLYAGSLGTTNSSSNARTAKQESKPLRYRISGQVVSKETQKPIPQVRIFIRGDSVQTQSDAKGFFTLSVPQKTKRITFLHSQYSLQHYPLSKEKNSSSPSLKNAKSTPIKVELLPQQSELEDSVIILPRIDQSSVLAQLEQRKNSVSVSDSLSLDDIKKSADSNASAATRRIVGATVIGGAYLNVRGLGGRYTSVRLNGVALPSTDPDLPGFQIDLFPVSLLTSLQIDKTFRPSIPGNFAGGSMDIRTRDFSIKDQLSLSISLSSDTQSFLRSSALPSSHSGDWIGAGASSRQLPNSFPNQRVSRSRNGLDRQAIIQAGQSLPVDWEGQDQTFWPNLSLGFRYSGSTRKLIGQRLGYLFTVGYRNQSTWRSGEVANVKLEGVGDEQKLSLRESLTRKKAQLASKLGALGALSLKINDWDEIRLISVLTQTGDSSLNTTQGISESEGLPIRQNQLQYLQRQLFFNQLLGTHEDLYEDLDLSWRLNVAQVQRLQPDTRDLLYVKVDQGYAYRNVTGSGERLFSDLGQFNYGGGIDLENPIKIKGHSWTLKGGGLTELSTRSWSARRFGTQIVSGTQQDRFLDPNAFFASDRYGPSIDLVELTRPSDGYTNQNALWAGYVSASGQVFKGIKMMLGVRYESFEQTIQVASPFAQNQSVTDESQRSDHDFLPAFTLIYSPWKKTNLRFAYGGTVARPLVRELAPFLQQDFVRRRTITGNPNLKRTWIDNFDLRLEWFPSDFEVFALSFFTKHFESPIESIIKDQNGNLGFENTPSAQNAGLELEARLQLKRWISSLTHWQLLSNFTWTASQVSLSAEQAEFVTSQSRPLQGQSPYVINAGLSYEPPNWSVNLFYNVFGPRILDVGMFGIPDVFERPFHSLDFTLSWTSPQGLSIGFSAQNLLNQALRLEQDRFPFRVINPGMKFGLRMGYQFEM